MSILQLMINTVFVSMIVNYFMGKDSNQNEGEPNPPRD